jgi:hypothetical protein
VANFLFPTDAVDDDDAIAAADDGESTAEVVVGR